MRPKYTLPKQKYVLACLILFAGSSTSAATPPTLSEARRTLAGLPAWFEANCGQFAPSIKYFSRRGSGVLLVNGTGATFQASRDSLSIDFIGAAQPISIEGVEPTGSHSSYLTGNHPDRWKYGIPHYAKVRAREIYPGVDVVYYLAAKQLEFDLTVAPGADPRQIRLAFKGAGAPRLDTDGDLVFANGVRQHRPVAYQEGSSSRVAVDAEYVIAKNGDVTLKLEPYDSTQALVIDPVLYAGYLGGDAGDTAKAIAVDQEGNVWVTGSSASTITLPSGQTPPIQDSPKGQTDVFLAKLARDAEGQLSLAYWTQLGGSSADEAEAIAVDNAGFVYLAGSTSSTDFPGAGQPLQTGFSGETDAFVAKIRPTDPSGLWYSQVYGGTNTEVAYSVAVDSADAIYFAGYTTSQDLPLATAPPAQGSNRGGYEGFLVEVLPDTSEPLAFATYFGGSSTDVVTAVTVSSPGNVYLAGYTASDDFPVTSDGFQSQMRSNLDGFLVWLDLSRPGLDSIVYGTYVGGDGPDVVRAMMLDEEGGLWLAGYTLSQDFPVSASAISASNAGGADLFLTRFDIANLRTENAISYSTYLGGTDTDVLYGMTLAPGGRIALAGYTYSSDFPQIGGDAVTLSGADAFVALLDPAVPGADSLVYSALFGGSLVDVATGIAADAAGTLFVSGFTTSADLPVTDGSAKLVPGGATQSFVQGVAADH
jgi:hypothetical protein